MRLVRKLLDEHDMVFVFLLRWRPERFGVSADSGVAQLRLWCAALPPSDLARLVLEAVQHDHEAGGRMRHHLGPAADPHVVVCFSQKYANETARIERDWLPIYTAEFAKAQPIFLTDEVDPGAAACGTASFAEAVAAFKEANASSDERATASAEVLAKWRPEQETEAGFTSYVQSLVQGAHGEPFYTPKEKAQLEAAFFGDTQVFPRRLCHAHAHAHAHVFTLSHTHAHKLNPAPPSPPSLFCARSHTQVLRMLDAQWRTNKIPGGATCFLPGKAENWGTFWKTHALASDEALFKVCVCVCVCVCVDARTDLS